MNEKPSGPAGFGILGGVPAAVPRPFGSASAAVSPQLLAALLSPAHASPLEALLDTQPDLIFYVKDSQGRYVMVNEALRRRSGRAMKSDLLGRTAAEVFTGEVGERTQLQDEQTLQLGQELHDVLEFYLTAQGTPVWCLTDKLPLRGGSGEVLGLVGLSRDLPPASQHAEFPRVASALAYIHAHFADGSLRLRDVAAHVGLSADTLERLFRRVTHLTPKQLLLRVRFDHAVRLLRRPELSVSEVAHACGYSDHSAFTRKFRRMAGISPQAYRRRLRELGQL
ncbi:transcriptional regulator with PAS/PAC sensors, AraC family (plasmid) [Deinococcus proteolyticus MRP]|uniref:Transcriptional regulator with PAS/PAC sensors, AraC family n=1 Tax=Deinococcus proteolyticus (strain ATCC 35074 / DSM 20540 / JCM 6276 / NBRC 101906 / NCIMB 13154 / VKM Ac-1939 / CCM 2703 / MRP) TaxID=693977 RepID=F0RPL8_DEIPM|nr:transcriptional regulator with PAS/PAC sensors, AraC family [Deinococcus proteolyticus MRP]